MNRFFHLLLRLFSGYLAILIFFGNADPLFADSLSRPAPRQLSQGDSLQKGLAALQENRIEDALANLTEAEREHPEDARVRNFRGIVLVRLGKNEQAASEYREAIRLDPQMEDAYRNLGFLEWNNHELESARVALDHAVELSPSDAFAHYYLGRVLLDEQLYPQAIREIESSKVPLPADTSFSIQLATAHIALGNKDKARKLLEQLATIPLDEQQSIHVAALFLALRENDSAIRIIQKLSTAPSTPENLWRQFDLALAYLLAGNFSKAIAQVDFYQHALTRGDANAHESAEAWTILGIAAADLKQNDRSLNAFHKAAALAPGSEENWLNLTRELMELSRYSDAISAVQDGLAANPKSYSLHLRLGAAQLAAGHYAEGEKNFRDLVAAGDPLPTGYVGLAQVLLRTGRAEEAAGELSIAQRKLGPNFLISYFRGLALDRSGKREEAIAAFQDALKLDPSNAEAHLSLGKTEMSLGRLDAAITELHEALRLSPNNEQTRRLLSQAYARAGDKEHALAFAATSANAPENVEADLLGDFFVPQWQMPPEIKNP
ncbi:MAG TPA: tetratricopeptide repeat protein [Verrucomicrobiae bacterium]|nr:tetratricopeptide repeat protein [Verrucomicrobiae bacterium]